MMRSSLFVFSACLVDGSNRMGICSRHPLARGDALFVSVTVDIRTFLYTRYH